MNRLRRLVAPLFIVVSCLAAVPLIAGKPPWSGQPPIVFDSSGTPLQSAIQKANNENAKKKKDKLAPGEKKDKCGAALASGDAADIAKWCDVAKTESKKLGEQDFKHADGKSAGKRTVTRTVLEFETPNQKGRPGDPSIDKWPSAKLKAFEQKAAHSPGPANGHALAAAVLPSSADNDDRDCVDWITGDRFGGAGVADGSAKSCFDADGKLKATLSVATPADTCRHTSGSIFFGDASDGIEDDCWDAKNVLRTTLVESIDEDGPESLDNDGDGDIGEDPPNGINDDNDCISLDGQVFHGSACSGKGQFGESYLPLVDEDGDDSVDNDGDGRLNEDAPAAQLEDECQRLYRKAGLEPRASDKDSSGQCDIGRALVKFVNDEALKRPNGRKLFQANDDGTFDPEATDGIEPGKETRRMTLTESFGVKCKKGSTFVDGVCVNDDDLAAAGGEAAFHNAMVTVMSSPVANPAANPAANNDGPDISRVAMMGFTFAPPVIEWGYRIDEEVCVLGICVEVFYARIGYEFDLAVGLRLPVQIDVLDQPESVLAGRDVTLQTTVEPLDFKSSEFESFCNEHDMADGLIISDCHRFGFPDFLDASLPLISDAKKDGDEFVARYTVFAGVIVRVLGIPLVTAGIDSSLDLPAACTMMRLLEVLKDVPEGVDISQVHAAIALVMGFANSNTTEDAAIELVSFIKEIAGSCGTFTTPFGLEDGELRTFPFAGEYEVPADCVQAIVEGKVITVGGRPRPICTNMILGVHGASLGIGLGLEATVGSRLIDGSFATSEDVVRNGGVQWTKSSNEEGSASSITIRPDNYDPADFRDTARISLDDFTYYLNALQIALKANFEFGGILDPIPDIGGFTIYNFIIDFGSYGIPVPQHPGTGDIALEIPVENYGLKLNVTPQSNDPKVRVDPDTLLIEPGRFGMYDVAVRNIGSRTGAFDNFRIALSNRPGQTPPYSYDIDPNTDHDCVPAGNACVGGGAHSRGDPYDGVADACYDAAGVILSTMRACIDEDSPSATPGLSRAERDDDGDGIPDEDPPEQWLTNPTASAFETARLSGLAPYTWAQAANALHISVSPFRHPYTAPGIYPIRIKGDSEDAKAHSMAATDPSGNARMDAKDESFLQVKSFFEPQVVVLPNFDGGKPSITRPYTIEGTNGGNVDDSMTVQVDFLDFNQAGCTLTNLGRLAPETDPGCQYRAVPTAIPVAWTTEPALSPALPPAPGKLEPLESATDAFTIAVPRDWAGMDDTTYRFRVTTVSQHDPDAPPATKNFIARHTVTATKESMTRYIGLEIADLIATLTAAESAGIKLGGLKPIVIHPILMMNNNALEAILAGNFAKASNNHATSIQLMQAFVKALDGGGKTLPPALFADLHKRAAAMIADMAAAQASNIPSAP